jgi:hypothetical protein
VHVLVDAVPAGGTATAVWWWAGTWVAARMRPGNCLHRLQTSRRDSGGWLSCLSWSAVMTACCARCSRRPAPAKQPLLHDSSVMRRPAVPHTVLQPAVLPPACEGVPIFRSARLSVICLLTVMTCCSQPFFHLLTSLLASHLFVYMILQPAVLPPAGGGVGLEL